MIIFVTGGAGFIGGNLAISLVYKGANVFGLIRNQKKGNLNLKVKNLKKEKKF